MLATMIKNKVMYMKFIHIARLVLTLRVIKMYEKLSADSRARFDVLFVPNY